MSRFLIIGGGIVGLSTAYSLQQAHPDARITVLEKETTLAAHQTGHNSGVIHSGIYYKPGSYKARLCVRGYQLLLDFARTHQIPHEVCGKLIVATNTAEADRLQGILERGIANGLTGLRRIGPGDIREREPFIQGVAALEVPQTGIIDYAEVVRTLRAVLTRQPQNRVLTGQTVTAIRQAPTEVRVTTDIDAFTADRVVVCGGLQADRLARLDGLHPAVRIVPFRGDYYDLVPQAHHKINHLVYPVPDPAFPFLGVHFTRMIQGGVECGPNAVFAWAREQYTKTGFSLSDAADALTYAGTWRLFARHWRKGWGEYQRAFSKKQFLQALRVLMPQLQMEDIEPARAGIRAMALDASGNMSDDFVFMDNQRVLHVLNAPSPAATAGLAIGMEIASRMK